MSNVDYTMVSPAELAAYEEEFHSDYRVFVNALEMLGYAPEQQCAAMGDVNGAWEMKSDVGAGKYLVGRGYLTAEQESWICALVGALDTVPVQVLPAGAGRETNLVAMRHASWVPLRVIAAHVLDVLKPFTAENARYLHLR
jgi:hypothetical protein